MKLEELPHELQPNEYLNALESHPTEWVTVIFQTHTDSENGGASCALIDVDQVDAAISKLSWNGRELGTSSVWRGGDDVCQFSDGLLSNYGVVLEFFAHDNRFSGLAHPRIEFTPSFLWFFKGVPRPDGSWYFVTKAGIDVELIRIAREGNALRVEINATPLRRYLAARKKCLLIQHDLVRFSPLEIPEDLTVQLRRDGANLELYARSDTHFSKAKSFSRLLGKHVVWPLDIDPCADTDYDRDDGPFPEFIYDVDERTGEPKTFSCREGHLSNYFVDRGTPHYLTPTYFRREVLTKYVQQPRKYRVMKRDLSCLNLWSLRMDINSAGLVEVYLGDLGKYLPAEEREYWKSFNVPPEGGMNEERYRNDLLAEWVDWDDPTFEMQQRRAELDEEFENAYGKHLYRQLHADDETSFAALHPMATEDLAELDALVVCMAKGLVDAIDVAALREVTGDDSEKSLGLLSALTEALGGRSNDTVDPLRAVQTLRSTSAAHTKGDNYTKALAKYGFVDVQPSAVYAELVRGATGALVALRDLLQARAGQAVAPTED